MLANPKPGQLVQVWYGKMYQPFMPLHGKTGVIQIIATGPGPRMHGVEIDGITYAIPWLNLRPIRLNK